MLSILDTRRPENIFIIFYGFFILASSWVEIFVDQFDFNISESSIILVNIFIAGYIIGLKIIQRKNENAFLARPPQDMTFIFYLVGMLLFIMAYLKIGYVPVLLGEDVENIRVDAKQGLGPFILLGSGFIYASTIYNAVNFTENNYKKRLLTIILSTVGLIMIAGFGYRGPVADCILFGFLAAIGQTSEYRKINRLKLKYVLFAIIFAFLLSAIGYLRHGKELASLGFEVFHWMIFVNFSNLDYIYKHYSIYDYALGATYWSDILASIPGMGEKFFGNKLKDILNLSFNGEGVTVTVVGEAYANFGASGVMLISIILGILTRVIQNKTLQYKFGI